jgi:hypothetical protein
MAGYPRSGRFTRYTFRNNITAKLMPSLSYFPMGGYSTRIPNVQIDA